MGIKAVVRCNIEIYEEDRDLDLESVADINSMKSKVFAEFEKLRSFGHKNLCVTFTNIKFDYVDSRDTFSIPTVNSKKDFPKEMKNA